MLRISTEKKGKSRRKSVLKNIGIVNKCVREHFKT